MKSFLRKRDLLGQVMSAHIRLSRAIELEVRRRTPVQQISDDICLPSLRSTDKTRLSSGG